MGQFKICFYWAVLLTNVHDSKMELKFSLDKYRAMHLGKVGSQSSIMCKVMGSQPDLGNVRSMKKQLNSSCASKWIIKDKEWLSSLGKQIKEIHHILTWMTRQRQVGVGSWLSFPAQELSANKWYLSEPDSKQKKVILYPSAEHWWVSCGYKPFFLLLAPACAHC